MPKPENFKTILIVYYAACRKGYYLDGSRAIDYNGRLPQER